MFGVFDLDMAWHQSIIYIQFSHLQNSGRAVTTFKSLQSVIFKPGIHCVNIKEEELKVVI